jgi:hypothetical protein
VARRVTDGPAAGARRARLPARLFYGLILGGVLLGAAAFAAAGWSYLAFGDARPTGRRVWDGIADQFVVPISAMIGATFGGLLGVVAAVGLDARRRRRRGS